MPVKGVSCGRQHGDSKLGACDSECVGHPLHLTRPLLFCPPTVGLGEMWWSSTGLAYPHPLLQSQACCTGWLPGRPQLCEEACSQPSYSAAAAAKKGKLPFGLAEEGLLGTVATGTGNGLAGRQQCRGGAARSYRSWLCLRHEKGDLLGKPSHPAVRGSTACPQLCGLVAGPLPRDRTGLSSAVVSPIHGGFILLLQ